MAKRNYGRMTADAGLFLFRPMQLNLTMPDIDLPTAAPGAQAILDEPGVIPEHWPFLDQEDDGLLYFWIS
jgi:hypothetical protein